MQKFSFHTHTTGFDGRNTEEEMIRRAEELGWNKIGFSNHLMVHARITEAPMFQYAQKGGYNGIYSSSFDEAVAKFESHYKRIDELQEKTDIKILKGMEVDFFADEGWQRGFEDMVKYLKPDYLIGSAHFVDVDGILYNSHDLKNASKIKQQQYLTRYWQNVRATAKSGYFTFLAHLDLMKKVGLGQEENWIEEEKKTVDAIREAGVMVELNTSYFKKGNEPYPSPRIMKMLADADVMVLLSDDAHAASQLGNNFDRAYDMAKECGITNFYGKQNNCAISLFLSKSKTQSNF